MENNFIANNRNALIGGLINPLGAVYGASLDKERKAIEQDQQKAIEDLNKAKWYLDRQILDYQKQMEIGDGK